jgi:hypothetical protein
MSVEHFKPSLRVALSKVDDIEISTVKLNSMGHGYETCLFRNDGKSKVVEKWLTETDALHGHIRWVNLILEFDCMKKKLFGEWV